MLSLLKSQAMDLYVKAEHNVWRNNHGELYFISYESIKLADTEFNLLVSPSFHDKGEIAHSYVRNIMVQLDEAFVLLSWLREGKVSNLVFGATTRKALFQHECLVVNLAGEI